MTSPPNKRHRISTFSGRRQQQSLQVMSIRFSIRFLNVLLFIFIMSFDSSPGRTSTTTTMSTLVSSSASSSTSSSATENFLVVEAFVVGPHGQSLPSPSFEPSMQSLSSEHRRSVTMKLRRGSICTMMATDKSRHDARSITERHWSLRKIVLRHRSQLHIKPPSSILPFSSTLHLLSSSFQDSDYQINPRRPLTESEKLAWLQRFEEMKQYQGENNGSSYPPRGTPLGNWAERQRKNFNKKQLYSYRIELLDSINFQWSKPRSGAWLGWDRMYDRLVDYKERCGDTKVPLLYPKDQQLGYWCYNQKVSFHEGTLDSERKSRLDGIGFVFDEIVSLEERWYDKYDRLIEYWKKNNSTIVPQTYEDDPGLGKWVQKQRYLYNKNDSRMTPERIERLEAIGFVWDPLEAKWQELYNHIVEFKQENGNADVKRNHPILGTWVNTQRWVYRKGKMPPGRIEKLEAIGFKWGKSKGEKDEARWD